MSDAFSDPGYLNSQWCCTCMGINAITLQHCAWTTWNDLDPSWAPYLADIIKYHIFYFMFEYMPKDLTCHTGADREIKNHCFWKEKYFLKRKMWKTNVSKWIHEVYHSFIYIRLSHQAHQLVWARGGQIVGHFSMGT